MIAPEEKSFCDGATLSISEKCYRQIGYQTSSTSPPLAAKGLVWTHFHPQWCADMAVLVNEIHRNTRLD